MKYPRLPYIKLDDGSYKVHIGHDDWMIVDKQDLSLALKYHWHLFRNKRGNPNCVKRGTNRNGQFYFHREILGVSEDIEVDHRDGDPTNNRRNNLREARRIDNARNVRISTRNTSGYKGVSWASKTREWQVFCRHKWIGSFPRNKLKDAATAYDYEALKIFGEFAKLNDGPRLFRFLSYKALTQNQISLF